LPILKILKYGHPLLRETCGEVRKFGARERDLVAAMTETMYAARGIGLAAPQVGVMERLFLVDVDQDRDSENPESTRLLRVVFNPEIIWESEEDEPYNEGCLSIPGIEGEVYRPSRIKIVGRDENFEPVEIEADKLLARVIQHETDHLNGILFVDKLPLLKRSMLGRELGRMKRETLDEPPRPRDSYPVVL
jgi:peptide deformylase